MGLARRCRRVRAAGGPCALAEPKNVRPITSGSASNLALARAWRARLAAAAAEEVASSLMTAWIASLRAPLAVVRPAPAARTSSATAADTPSVDPWPTEAAADAAAVAAAEVVDAIQLRVACPGPQQLFRVTGEQPWGPAGACRHRAALNARGGASSPSVPASSAEGQGAASTGQQGQGESGRMALVAGVTRSDNWMLKWQRTRPWACGWGGRSGCSAV